jgi:hypothetical protein
MLIFNMRIVNLIAVTNYHATKTLMSPMQNRIIITIQQYLQFLPPLPCCCTGWAYAAYCGWPALTFRGCAPRTICSWCAIRGRYSWTGTICPTTHGWELKITPDIMSRLLRFRR